MVDSGAFAYLSKPNKRMSQKDVFTINYTYRRIPKQLLYFVTLTTPYHLR